MLCIEIEENCVDALSWILKHAQPIKSDFHAGIFQTLVCGNVSRIFDFGQLRAADWSFWEIAECVFSKFVGRHPPVERPSEHCKPYISALLGDRTSNGNSRSAIT